MDPHSEELLEALDLHETTSKTGTGFTGVSLPTPDGRIFGGQFVAQSVVAAQRSAMHGHEIRSAHAYFTKPGSTREAVHYLVTPLSDERHSSVRLVQAHQSSGLLFTLLARMAVPDAREQLSARPRQVPEAPSDGPLADPGRVNSEGEFARFWTTGRAFESIHSSGPLYIPFSGRRSPCQSVWTRAVGALPNDPKLHTALLGYLSDDSILDPALRAHGLSWVDPRVRAASLDHAIWWHEPGRVDDWLFTTQECPSTQGGRGLGVGRVYTREGRLLATVVQEGMIRARKR